MPFTDEEKKQLVGMTRNKIQAQSAQWRTVSSKVFLASVRHQNILLIDDGLATGLTLLAAIRCLRRHGVARITVAVPVAPREALLRFRKIVEDMIVLSLPRSFSAVGEWYEDFSQVPDEEVTRALEQYRSRDQRTSTLRSSHP
jgi:predicted phosphoribosyltransferase